MPVIHLGRRRTESHHPPGSVGCFTRTRQALRTRRQNGDRSQTLLEEMKSCAAEGLLSDDRDLIIGERAHVILPTHKLLDGLKARQRRARHHATGIGPAYGSRCRDAACECAICCRRLVSRERIAHQLEETGPILAQLGGTVPDVDALTTQYLAYGEALRPHAFRMRRVCSAKKSSAASTSCSKVPKARCSTSIMEPILMSSSTTLAAGACVSCGSVPRPFRR